MIHEQWEAYVLQHPFPSLGILLRKSKDLIYLFIILVTCLHQYSIWSSFVFDANRAAATALAERHADGSLPVEDFNIEVEDQSGKKVRLGSETDQRYLPFYIVILYGWNCLNIRVLMPIFCFHCWSESQTVIWQGSNDGIDASCKGKTSY